MIARKPPTYVALAVWTSYPTESKNRFVLFLIKVFFIKILLFSSLQSLASSFVVRRFGKVDVSLTLRQKYDTRWSSQSSCSKRQSIFTIFTIWCKITPKKAKKGKTSVRKSFPSTSSSFKKLFSDNKLSNNALLGRQRLCRETSARSP